MVTTHTPNLHTFLQKGRKVMSSQTRIAVLSDTAGQYDALTTALTELGVDVANRIIPTDLRVIHLGDLVHKGPDSDKVVQLVNYFLRQHPNQWIQLVGNHEIQYWAAVDYEAAQNTPCRYRPELDPDSARIVGAWFTDGLLRFAYSLPKVVWESEAHLAEKYNNEKPWLFTHAGLTKDFLHYYLKGDKSSTVQEITESINSNPYEVMRNYGKVLSAEQFPQGRWSASPIWAAIDSELYASWGHSDYLPHLTMSFNQAHGHTVAFAFRAERPDWIIHGGYYPSEYISKTSLDWDNLRIICSLSDSEGVIVSLDAGYNYGSPTKGEPHPYLLGTVQGATGE